MVVRETQQCRTPEEPLNGYGALLPYVACVISPFVSLAALCLDNVRERVVRLSCLSYDIYV